MTLPCSQLDEFYDGELASAAAVVFRTHLASCATCQRQLRGRMQEALVVDEAAPAAHVIPIARARKNAIAILGAAVALAAAVALVWSLRGRTPEPSQLVVALTIERGGEHVRGSSTTTAHPGDVVHVQTTGTVWIYRSDRELVLACPGGRGCRADGADFPVSTIGSYSIVVLAGEHLPAPHGDLDTDVSATRVPHKIVPLTVD
ncbi:MAG: zf-HC2 domain-containing protein [Kofleriaceae bacterium]